jgi:hypothetical protein
MKRAHCVLLVILLCSCTAHREGSEAADSERIRVLDRSDPLVEHTFVIMEVRAGYSEAREYLRARGFRVCEVGENGTSWEVPQQCNRCWCEWGVLDCTKAGCPSSDDKYYDDEHTFEPPRDYREIRKLSGRSFCEEDQIGTSWQESCNRCWCADGFRVCSKADCPSSYHPKGAAATDDTE